MRKFILRLLSDPPLKGTDALAERVAKLEASLAEQHKRLLEVEGNEAVREAAHHARVDALARLYKRVSQRFVDAPSTNPDPPTEEPQTPRMSVLELRNRLRR
ncbi:MAG: hypothetical protein ACOYB0_10770 [Polynucleobacter sp.]